MADMAAALRLAVVAVVVLLLVRAARAAWSNRRLAVAVWRRIRPRHVLGSCALLVAVLGTAVGLMALVPASGLGLGWFVGLSGNAVFAPIEEINLRATGPAPNHASDVDDATAENERQGSLGTQPSTIGVTAAFLLLLLLLFPWLAYVEERVFREGLETASTGRQAWAALKFGLAHLVMLIPVAAALAIAVAGFVYGRVYRRAYRRSAARTDVVAGSFGVPLVVAPTVATARSHAVLASTVWHTTFNSLIVVLVLLGLVVETLLAG